MRLIALLSVALTQSGAVSDTLPVVSSIVEDDYPYQCVCKCENERRISVCDFDSKTPCYCDAPADIKATNSTR
jgi:hypothetical protein